MGVLCPYRDSHNTQRVTEPLALWPPKVMSLSKGQSWGSPSPARTLD